MEIGFKGHGTRSRASLQEVVRISLNRSIKSRRYVHDPATASTRLVPIHMYNLRAVGALCKIMFAVHNGAIFLSVPGKSYMTILNHRDSYELDPN